MKTTIKALFVLVIILIFSSCFSDWKSEATLTISFGQNGRAAAWISGEEVAPEVMEKITHKITLSNGTDVIPLTVVGKGSITETVAPGSWTVEIDALYDGDLLFAKGSWKGEVIAGQENHADVDMKESDDTYTFFTVDSANEWGNVMELINKEPTGKPCVIIVTKDFPANNLMLLVSNIIICGDHTVTLTGTGCLLNIGEEKTVTMRDVKLKGNGSNNSQALVMIMGGSFIMEGSASVCDNPGSGVYVYGGAFTMNGGEISGNTAGGAGGGVLVLNSGTFTMNGGSISDNKANAGGGVYLENGGKFIMNGGTIGGDGDGDANTAKYGGGVYVNKGGTFNMIDGKIIRNAATEGGGGVYVTAYDILNSIFNMSGGEISGNTVEGGYGGGGVLVIVDEPLSKPNSLNITFNMSGDAKIINNTVGSGAGGGVFVYGSNATPTSGTGKVTFNMSGEAVISGNTVGGGSGGGGVCLFYYATFNMNGGTISGNTVGGNNVYGGGVYVYEKGTFRISNGIIYGSESEIEVGLRNRVVNADGNPDLNARGHALRVEQSSTPGTAKRGIFIDDNMDTWDQAAEDDLLDNINYKDNTIRVENGNIVD